MPTGEQFVALVVGLIVAVTLFSPIQATVDTNTGVQSVTNESVTADAGNFTELDGFNLQSGTDTVYWLNSSSGNYETVIKGTDYELQETPGNIKALAAGNISDGDSLKVTYDYQATDDSTTTVVDLVPLFIAVLLLGLMGFYIRDQMR